MTGLESRGSGLLTAFRRILAFGVLAGLAMVVLRSYLVADGEVCRQAAGADTGTITLCGPIGPADLPALAVALLVSLILLLPDLSELDIAGLVTLKRAVAEQKKETEQLRSVVQAISLRQETNVNFYPRELGEAAEDVERKSEEAQTGRMAQAAAATEALAQGEVADSKLGQTLVDPARAVAEATIIRVWESIAERLGIGGALPRFSWRRRLMDEGAAGTEQWLELFGRDLEAFRAVRNSVVHRPDTLSQIQLDQALLLGQRLDRTLDDWRRGTHLVMK